jgi:hypothetical protein
LASTPQGAERLNETVSRQEPGVLDNLTGALSGQGPRFAEQGSNLLGSLMGGGMSSKLGSVLSRFTGVGEASTGKLMGILTPVLLGFLGKQQKSMGLDAGGLANLLSGQKDNIRAAMPAGLDTALSSALPGVGQLFGGGARAATAEASRSYEEAAPRAQMGTDFRSREVYAQPAHTAGGKKWVVPLLLVLGALAAFLFWGNRNRQPQGAGGSGSERVAGTAGTFSSDTGRVLDQANGVLAGIKDPASAEAAAPRLHRINQQLTGLRTTWNRLPESARTGAKSALQPQIAKVKEAAQSVVNQPGLSDTVRPQIDELMQNLNAFSSQ